MKLSAAVIVQLIINQKSSIMYKGGKNGNGTYQTIINQIPPHDIYAELFTGSAAIYRKKKPAAISLLCDKSRKQINRLQSIILSTDISLCCDVISNINIFITLFNLLHSLNHPVFWYLDPPYPISSRSWQKHIYQHELSDKDHIALLTGIRSAQFPVAISTYENKMYSKKLHDWRCLQYQSIVRGGTRTELLYMNYPESSQLHDYSYIGDTFREREALQRKKKNFIHKFKNLPPLLQNSLALEFSSLFDTISSGNQEKS